MLEHLVVPIEWKADTSGDGNTLIGYASTFGNVDLGGDVVMPGAFTKTISNIKASGIPLLADHMGLTSSVLGTIYDASEDKAGLLIKARISSAPSAQDTAVKLREGHLNRMSIGYETMEEAYTEGKDGQRVRQLKEVKLWETSVVVFPMNPKAAITAMKSALDTLDPADARTLIADVASSFNQPHDHDGAPASPDAEGKQMNQETKDAVDLLASLSAADRDEALRALVRADMKAANDAEDANILTQALGWFSAVDNIVDEAQEALADYLGVDNPDADDTDDSADGGGKTTASAPLTKNDPNAGDDPDSTPDEGVSGWNRWTSQALIDGRPLVEADPVKRAELLTRLELAESQLPSDDVD